MESKMNSSWFQKIVSIAGMNRGCHLITDKILSQVPEIQKYSIGMMHLFLQHTSASLCINESYDSDVLLDMEDSLNRIVPENTKLYRHVDEGSDDMPSHVKNALVGVSLSVPITNGKLNLGTWQGIWLLEHRNAKSQRDIVVTIQGQEK
eukprot:TRINITY_DN534_c0_g1_i1.p2 TRINITY_DN534_c0_g1~~TRINITY_DN534_c0_g1_i1.p2  ORF type:complete len:149 (-),score=9.41 TRINITY_DN534_c0_g1_i1:118-564(-)